MSLKIHINACSRLPKATKSWTQISFQKASSEFILQVVAVANVPVLISFTFGVAFSPEFSVPFSLQFESYSTRKAGMHHTLISPHSVALRI